MSFEDFDTAQETAAEFARSMAAVERAATMTAAELGALWEQLAPLATAATATQEHNSSEQFGAVEKPSHPVSPRPRRRPNE